MENNGKGVWDVNEAWYNCPEDWCLTDWVGYPTHTSLTLHHDLPWVNGSAVRRQPQRWRWRWGQGCEPLAGGLTGPETGPPSSLRSGSSSSLQITTQHTHTHTHTRAQNLFKKVGQYSWQEIGTMTISMTTGCCTLQLRFAQSVSLCNRENLLNI